MLGRDTKRSTRVLAAFFSFAGTMHFVRPRTYMAIMPDYLPAHRELIYASGVAEIAGGLGALSERTRGAAGWWLAATMVAVFRPICTWRCTPSATAASRAPCCTRGCRRRR